MLFIFITETVLVFCTKNAFYNHPFITNPFNISDFDFFICRIVGWIAYMTLIDSKNTINVNQVWYFGRESKFVKTFENRCNQDETFQSK